MVKRVFTLWVVPGSKKTQFEGVRETGELVLRLKELPVKGKANQAVIEFLAETYEIPKRSISILSGHKSRRKKIEIILPQDAHEPNLPPFV